MTSGGGNYLLETLNNIIQRLEECRCNEGDSYESVALRLEVVVESALLDETIPLDVCDLINQARQVLQKNQISCDQQSTSSFEAPVLREDGRRGRPRFSISEEQLLYFKGREKDFHYYMCGDVFMRKHKP